MLTFLGSQPVVRWSLLIYCLQHIHTRKSYLKPNTHRDANVELSRIGGVH